MVDSYLLPYLYLSRLLSVHFLSDLPARYALGILPLLALAICDCVTIAACYDTRTQAPANKGVKTRLADSIDEPTIHHKRLMHPGSRFHSRQICCCFASTAAICGLDGNRLSHDLHNYVLKHRRPDPLSFTLEWYTQNNLRAHMTRCSSAKRAQVSLAAIWSQVPMFVITCMWLLYSYWMETDNPESDMHESLWALILV